MKRSMKLIPKYYDFIKNEIRRIELRLCDKKVKIELSDINKLFF